MRILIVRPDKIGDVILTLPMATAIKSARPNAHVTFLIREYTAPLFSLAVDVDQVLIYERNLPLKKTIALLRSANLDAIFILGHKFKLTLAAFLARVPIRVGRASWWFSFLYNKKIYEHRKTAERNEADYNVRMLREIGIDAKETPLPNLDHAKLPKISLRESSYIVLHTGTGGSTRVWNENNFCELAKEISNIYRCTIILTGTAEDKVYLSHLSERMKLRGSDVHIITENTLAELASLLAGASFVVACGTGPGHLAAALGAPTIGLFPNVLSLSKERWGFRGKRVKNLSPLTMPKKECPQCKDCICIDEVTVSQVLEAIEDLKVNADS